MIMDRKTTFSLAQAVTATAISTDVLNLGPRHSENLTVDLGAEQSFLSVTVTEAALAAGAATVEFQLITDNVSNMASPAVLWTSGAIGKAVLVAGYQLRIPLPSGKYEQYLAINYIVATGPLTAGKFTAGLVDEPGAYQAHASAVKNGVN